MKSFQMILEECLSALANDTITMDECLARYPQHAEQLKPILRTVRFLKLGRTIKPSFVFKSYSRVYLAQHLRFNPRHSQRLQLSRQVVMTIAVLIAALLFTGTAHAQSAMPGNNFYPWKRATEEIWRALSINPVDTDIALSQRRFKEWMAVADDPALSSVAMQGYFAELDRLKQMDNTQTHKFILPVIKNHHDILNEAGLPAANLMDAYLTLQFTPSPVAALSQVLNTITPMPTVTPQPTSTLKPAPTATPTDPAPTITPTQPAPTATPTDPAPTATPTDPAPTATPTDPAPTATPTDPAPTAAPAQPAPTDTAIAPLDDHGFGSSGNHSPGSSGNHSPGSSSLSNHDHVPPPFATDVPVSP